MRSTRGFYAIRRGDWKLITELESGGFSKPSKIEPDPGEATGQLSHVQGDLGETRYLWKLHPKLVNELKALSTLR